ncbi:MAG: Transglycosylase-associated protein, partial [uncultured Nocardioidaceae bacterium]
GNRQRLHRHPGRHRLGHPGPTDHPGSTGDRLDPHVHPRDRRSLHRWLPGRRTGPRCVVAGLPGPARRGRRTRVAGFGVDALERPEPEAHPQAL